MWFLLPIICDRATGMKIPVNFESTTGPVCAGRDSDFRVRSRGHSSCGVIPVDLKNAIKFRPCTVVLQIVLRLMHARCGASRAMHDAQQNQRRCRRQSGLKSLLCQFAARHRWVKICYDKLESKPNSRTVQLRLQLGMQRLFA